MTSPTTYRIADKAPVFPCWVFDSRKWIYERERIFPTDTHWCSGIPIERPTHDPTAPASPASSAAKGGDIPRTPTDSEMLDWLENAQFTYHVLIQSQPHGDVMHDRTPFAGSVRAAIAAEMMKKA